MEVASLSPVPVGVLTWSSPDPLVTVIVKATFDVEADGSVSLVPDQPPMSLDRASRDDDDRHIEIPGVELFYASDFAPCKAAVDVLVVGHARSRAPTHVFPLRLAVGALDLALVAVTDTPTTRAPLTARHVRRVPTDPATAVRLAPAPSSVSGWVSRTVAPGFDYAVFNTASFHHRLHHLSPDATVHTRGLLRRGDRPIVLAGVAPRVFHVADRKNDEPGVPVPMTCDTLWLDVDREHVVLVWRGHVARGRPGMRPFLVVKLHGPGDVTWRDVSRRIARAVWVTATQPHELTPPSELPAAALSEPTLAAGGPFDEPETTTARLAKKLRWGEGGEVAPPPEHAAREWSGDTPGVGAAGKTLVAAHEDELETIADATPLGPPSDPIPLTSHNPGDPNPSG